MGELADDNRHVIERIVPQTKQRFALDDAQEAAITLALFDLYMVYGCSIEDYPMKSHARLTAQIITHILLKQYRDICDNLLTDEGLGTPMWSASVSPPDSRSPKPTLSPRRLSHSSSSLSRTPPMPPPNSSPSATSTQRPTPPNSPLGQRSSHCCKAMPKANEGCTLTAFSRKQSAAPLTRNPHSAYEKAPFRLRLKKTISPPMVFIHRRALHYLF